MLVTALNLIPTGQLDGGHISYAVFGRRSTTITLVAIGLAVTLTFVSMSWLVWTVMMVVMLFPAAVAGDRHRHKGERQDGEDKRLDQTDKSLQSHENQRHQEGKQERDDQQENFAGKNIAEKSEGEREDFGDLADQFDHAHKQVDQAQHEDHAGAAGLFLLQNGDQIADPGDLDKLAEITEKAVRPDAIVLGQTD